MEDLIIRRAIAQLVVLKDLASPEHRSQDSV